MTTIDYKEKYEQALEVAQRFYNNSVAITKKGLEDIFPELAESEDEKIRKALLEMVHDTTGDSLWVDYNVHKEDALAWLEKQGDKTAWSEDDKNRINRLIAYFEDKESFTAEDDVVYANWLKSLRPQSQWKPSEEQMEALESIFAKHGAFDDDLLSLISDLKKLKG